MAREIYSFQSVCLGKMSRHPIVGWCLDFLIWLSSFVGKFIYIDDCTSKKTRLDSGSILMSTSSLKFIYKKVVIVVGETKFYTTLIEDCCEAMLTPMTCRPLATSSKDLSSRSSLGRDAERVASSP